MQVDCTFLSATIYTIIFTLPIYSAQSWAFKMEWRLLLDFQLRRVARVCLIYRSEGVHHQDWLFKHVFSLQRKTQQQHPLL